MTKQSGPVYVVDDDASVREAVGRLIRSAGWSLESFATAQEFLASRWATVPGCLILDVQLPGLSGLDLQQQLARSGTRTSIIFLTGHGDIPTSVRAIKNGALEFLTKPYADDELIAAVAQGLARVSPTSGESVAAVRGEPRPSSPAHTFNRASGHSAIGQSAGWQDAVGRATQVACTNSTVFLHGESGTGKEVLARLIHQASPRKDGPFVAINCAALPETLLESELFGYERGAFTGALQSKAGQIEMASAGVLFLDEVSEMSPAAQAKFLRVLQEREFQRLGGTRLLKTNARVIAATNRDLLEAVNSGAFRADLYYRLQVFDIRIPPLRERTDDIPPLVEAFLEELGRSLGCQVAGVSPQAMDILLGYSWPGNVRELRNALERAAILCAGGVISPAHLSLHAPQPMLETSTTDLRERERTTLVRVLQETDWNKAKAARRLGLTRTQLYVRLRRYDIAQPAAV